MNGKKYPMSRDDTDLISIIDRPAVRLILRITQLVWELELK